MTLGTLLVLLQAVSSSEPMFVDGAEGYIKLLGAIGVAGATLGGLIGFWLKKRDDARWERVKGMMDGVGARIDVVDIEQKLHQGWFTNARDQQLRLDGKVSALGERVAKAETSMERLDRDITEHHNDIRNLIEKSTREQLEAVHEVKIEVARLQERSNIGEHLSEMGKSIERAIRIAVHREASQ